MRDHTSAAGTASISVHRAKKMIQQRLVVLEAARVALADVMSSAQILAEERGEFDPLHHLGLAYIGADRTLREFLRSAAAVMPADAVGPAAPSEEAPR